MLQIIGYGTNIFYCNADNFPDEIIIIINWSRLHYELRTDSNNTNPMVDENLAICLLYVMRDYSLLCGG